MSTRPYPSYKNSGVEWLGRIPAHWAVKRLKYVVRQNPESLPETTDPDYELQYLDIGNVEEVAGVGSPQEMRFSNAPSRARRRVRSGDTIVSTVRTYLKAIAYFDAPPENLIVSTGFAVLRPNREVHPRFLHALVRSRQFVEKIVTRSVGVGYPAINPGELSCLPVWLPPPTEQQAIAAFLDRETGKIDALVKKMERLIELLQEQRTALISHAVTQGLNPNAPMKDSGVPWLGQIPAHWECGRLKVRLKKIGQGWSPLCEHRPAQEGEWGVLKVGCMNGSIYDESENKTLPIEIEPAKELEIRVGDVLMSRSNTVELVGSVGIVHETQGKILLCDKLFRLVFHQTKLLPEYAVSLLRSPVARKQIEAASSGASPSMKNISNGAVAGLVLPFPPVGEQQVILKHISEQTAKLDALTAKVRTTIERLQEYRTALISAAVTGQIDVRSVSTL